MASIVNGSVGDNCREQAFAIRSGAAPTCPGEIDFVCYRFVVRKALHNIPARLTKGRRTAFGEASSSLKAANTAGAYDHTDRRKSHAAIVFPLSKAMPAIRRTPATELAKKPKG
jgi:hypothetical protein